jgi:hypothetical protein
MAEVKLTRQTLPGMQLFSAGKTYYKSPPILDFSNTPVDLSAWHQFTLDLFTQSPNSSFPAPTLHTDTTSVTGNADGTLNITIDPAVITNLACGQNLNATVYGQHVTADPEEVLAFGTLAVVQG